MGAGSVNECCLPVMQNHTIQRVFICGTVQKIHVFSHPQKLLADFAHEGGLVSSGTALDTENPPRFPLPQNMTVVRKKSLWGVVSREIMSFDGQWFTSFSFHFSVHLDTSYYAAQEGFALILHMKKPAENTAGPFIYILSSSFSDLFVSRSGSSHLPSGKL